MDSKEYFIETDDQSAATAASAMPARSVASDNPYYAIFYVDVGGYECILEIGSAWYGKYHISVLLRHTPLYFECNLLEDYNESTAGKILKKLCKLYSDESTTYEFVDDDRNKIRISFGNYAIELINKRNDTNHQISLGFDIIFDQFNELKSKYDILEKERDELIKYKQNFEDLIDKIQSMS